MFVCKKYKRGLFLSFDAYLLITYKKNVSFNAISLRFVKSNQFHCFYYAKKQHIKEINFRAHLLWKINRQRHQMGSVLAYWLTWSLISISLRSKPLSSQSASLLINICAPSLALIPHAHNYTAGWKQERILLIPLAAALRSHITLNTGRADTEIMCSKTFSKHVFSCLNLQFLYWHVYCANTWQKQRWGF